MISRRTFLESSALWTASVANAARQQEIECDVAVIGGGVGGVAAALAAVRNGMKVVLTEETDWIGGQLTAQAVPPDEHEWIEHFGATKSYRDYREGVRAYYREHYHLTSEASAKPNLNPGNGSVSRLTHEPRVSVAVLEAMLAPYIQKKQLTVLRETVPETADLENNQRVRSVVVKAVKGGNRTAIRAKYFIDATETGELLPLAKTEYVVGAESQAQTGEPHAPSKPEPQNVQSFTCCFAIDYLEGEDHTVDKPRDYAFWRDYVPKLSPPWTGKLLAWSCPNPITLAPRALFFDPRPNAAGKGMNLWVYRRILDPKNFAPGTVKSAVSLVNWPQNDYWLGDLLSASPQEQKRYIDQAKQLSLSWLYWMQTEAPRADGKAGWRGLRLRKDIVGTEDGLAKYPYIRESRRIAAEFTILEQHVGLEARRKAMHLPPLPDYRTHLSGAQPDVAAASFHDSVGIGYYRLDLHPSTGGNNYIDIPSLRFQIPFGALIPKRMENLLAGSKNLGVTHITNGCYRLHPVEWNIGEAAGAAAAYAIAQRTNVREIRNEPKKLEAFQKHLRSQGFELEWPGAATKS